MKLSLKAVTKRRRLASKGESLAARVQRLRGDRFVALVDDGASAQLGEAQIADLRKRAKNPGPFASAKEVASVLSKFK